ncbi:MAG: hypothetical protein V7K36_29835 [Nostoc sp.]
MKKRILLTSFDIWLKDQQSNSFDDLLFEVTKLDLIPHDLSFLRQLPVDVQLASTQVIEQINAIQVGLLNPKNSGHVVSLSTFRFSIVLIINKLALS